MPIDLDRLEGALERGRAAALARMLSTATVRRKTNKTEQSEATGEEVPVWDDVHTDLPCRLVASRVGGASRSVDAGDVEVEQSTPRMDFPFDTDDLQDGDLIDLTAGEYSGSVYSIVEAVKGDQRSARRVPVIEAGRPTEWA